MGRLAQNTFFIHQEVSGKILFSEGQSDPLPCLWLLSLTLSAVLRWKLGLGWLTLPRIEFPGEMTLSLKLTFLDIATDNNLQFTKGAYWWLLHVIIQDTLISISILQHLWNIFKFFASVLKQEIQITTSSWYFFCNTSNS